GQGEGEPDRIREIRNHASGGIRVAVLNTDLELKRRIAAEQRRIVEQHSAVEDSGASANRRLLIQGIGQAQARLEDVLMAFRDALRNAAEQLIDIDCGIAEDFQTPIGGTGEAAPWERDPVETRKGVVSAGLKRYRAGFGINREQPRRVEGRIEGGDVVPD